MSQQTAPFTEQGHSTNGQKRRGRKPLLPSTAEREALELVKKYYSDSKRNRLQFERQWYSNLAFYFGRHYVQWTQGSQSATSQLNRLYEPPVPPWRARLVSNKIKPIIRKELAKVTKEKPQPFVIPASTDDDDLAAARAGEALFEHHMRVLQMDRIGRRMTFWKLLCGTAFIKDWYDPVLRDDEGVEGRVCLEVVNAFQILVPDTQEEELENQSYVIHELAKDPDWVEEVFKKRVVANTNASSGLLENKFLTAMGANPVSNNFVAVRECWIKPCSKYPDGAKITWAGDTMLDLTEEWPYQYREFPFTKFDHVPTGGFYGGSVIEDLIPLQKEYNRTRSQIIEAKNRMSKPQLVAARGSVDSSKITSEPGLVIYYTPGFQPPQPISLVNLPGYVVEELQRCQGDMDDIAGQHEISKGHAPSGVSAACIDEQTQALTRRGWKYWDELIVGEDILAYDPALDCSEWQVVQNVLSYEYSGKVRWFENNQISALTTPDHSWPVWKRGYRVKSKSIFEKQTSSNLIGRDYIPLCRPVQNAPEFSPYKDDYIELLGWILADGHFMGKDLGGGVKIHQATYYNVHKCKQIRTLLDNLGIQYTEFERWSTYKDEDYSITEFYIAARDGYFIRSVIPGKKLSWDLISELPRTQLLRLIEGLMGGDGSVSKTGQKQFHTVLDSEKDAFQGLCALAGITTGVYQDNRGKYVLTLKRDRFNDSAMIARADRGWDQFDGRVWCPTVKSGFWYARKDGRVFATGNTAISFLQEQDDSMIAPTISNFEEGVARIGRHILSHVAQFWEAERTIRTLGENNAWEVFTFNKAAIRGNTDLNVQAGSATPRSQAAKQAFIMEMMDKKYLPPERGLRYLGMAETNRMYEEMQVSARQAQRENLRMANGDDTVTVNQYDEHLVHLDEHAMHMRRQAFERYPDEIKMKFTEHYDMHKQVIGLQQGTPIAPGEELPPMPEGGPQDPLSQPMDGLGGMPVEVQGAPSGVPTQQEGG